jgi:AbiU2
MNVNAPEIRALRAKVRAASQEFDFAQKCHEAWKPAANDKALHERVGHSYAANTFLIVRQALRREMLLALLRLWDREQRTVRMSDIAKALGDGQIMDALATASAARFGKLGSPEFNYVKKTMGEELRAQAQEAIAIIRKYERGGTGHTAFTNLWTLRCERLAHRQVELTAIEAGDQDTLDKQTEAFYQDTSNLVGLLFHVVEKTGYNPAEGAAVYARYAELFWASVRGERTKGHPQYRLSSAAAITVP